MQQGDFVGECQADSHTANLGFCARIVRADDVDEMPEDGGLGCALRVVHVFPHGDEDGQGFDGFENVAVDTVAVLAADYDGGAARVLRDEHEHEQRPGVGFTGTNRPVPDVYTPVTAGERRLLFRRHAQDFASVNHPGYPP